MFVVKNILFGLAEILHYVITAYIIIIIIAALISWVNPDPYNPIIRALRAMTEPVKWRLRRLLPFVYAGGIDFSPIVIILILKFIDIALVDSMLQLAERL